MENNKKLADDLIDAYSLVAQIQAIANVITLNCDAELATQNLAWGIRSLSENLNKVLDKINSKVDVIGESVETMSSVV